jgi:hypothetical protein
LGALFWSDTNTTIKAISNWLRPSSLSVEPGTEGQAKSGEFRLVSSAVQTGSLCYGVNIVFIFIDHGSPLYV